MKVLLINPPYETNLSPGSFPLGLGYIASTLLKERQEVKIFDIRAHKYPRKFVVKELERSLNEYAAVGISGMITAYPYIKWLSSQIKRINSNFPIIVGGSIATSTPDLLLAKTQIDIACIGEGEITIKEILQSVEGLCDLSAVKGIYYKKYGKSYSTAPRELIKNLDTIPFPAWDLFPMEQYINNQLIVAREKGIRGLNLIATRGCPNRCVYCYRNFGRTVRFRSVDNVIEEIITLQRKYRITHFEFQDELFTMNKEWVHKFCNGLLDKEINITWRCLGRADRVDLETLRLMREAGCHWIGYGMESGSQKMLDIMCKDLNVKQIKEAIRLSRQAGLEVTGTFMIGMPGETLETIRETIEFCKEMKIYNEFFFTVPYPGTLLYDILKNDNFIKDEEKFVLQISGDMTNLFINLTDFSDAELIKIKKKAEEEIWNHIYKRKPKKGVAKAKLNNFTIQKNIIINNKIKQDLIQIINMLIHNFPNIESLVLVGGFGRGEGSVLIENGVPKPIDDYDIVLIANSDLDTILLKRLKKIITRKMGIRFIDIIPIKRTDLARLPYTQFNFDLKYGGYIFYGNSQILTEIPEMDPSKMPLIEGKILLFNRLVCLLESFSTEFLHQQITEEEIFFLVNQCVKANLACCDSLLMLKGKYHHSYHEKERRFNQLYKNILEVSELIHQSIAFKLIPRKPTKMDGVEFWFKTKRNFMKFLFFFLNRLYVYGPAFRNWEDFGEFYANLELNSIKSSLELSEIYLLASVENNETDSQLIELAIKKMNAIDAKERVAFSWENLRKNCINLWFKINKKGKKNGEK